MKHLLSAAVALVAMGAIAHAAPMTIGGVSFDTDNAASTVLWAQGGVTTGLAANRREACADPTDDTSTVGPTGVECRAVEAAGFDLDTSVELDSNGTSPDDILSVFFDNPLANGAGNCAAGDFAGCDLLVFEILDQPDNPTLSLTIGGMTILGVLLADVDIDTDNDGSFDDPVAIWGYDLTGLGLAIGDLANSPLFLGRDVGTPDIAAIVGQNFGDGVIPLPAAAPLFFAGLAGLGFAARRRRKAV